MARAQRRDASILQAALIGLEHQRNQIDATIAEIRRRIGASGSWPAAIMKPAPKKRRITAAARKRMADAQRKRWAAFRKQREQTKQAPAAKPKTKAKKAAIRKRAPRTAGKKAKPAAVTAAAPTQEQAATA